MAIPVIAYYIIFHYIPMYGLVMAFKDFSPRLGILHSPWIGIEHFKTFFFSYYSWRIIRNTLLISFYSLIWGFPWPIILALLINEVNNVSFKRIVQTITYLPHFIAMVVICGIIKQFTGTEGVINNIIAWMGGERQSLLSQPELFRTIFISSGIWQQVGWSSIIYLAAISSIDVQLYDAAYVEGANRLQQARFITVPGILPTMIILLILSIGQLMQVGWQKILLLYNPLIYETADVIQTFIYRKGILNMKYGFSTAVELFNSVINLVLIVTVNRVSKKITGTSLW
jgi:putative aldouronate transport system permease protein